MKMIRCLLLLAGCMLVSAPAFAAHIPEDSAPAPYRGQPNSVYAEFELAGFFGATVVDFQEGLGATYPLDGTIPTISSTPFVNPDGSATYTIELPNYIDNEPLKEMRIQISYFDGNGTGDAWTSLIVPLPGPGVVQQVGGGGPNLIAPPNLLHEWEDWEIWPNPDAEIIEVTFNQFADPHYIIIDTISIPEPTSIVLLSLTGGLIFAVRSRRLS